MTYTCAIDEEVFFQEVVPESNKQYIHSYKLSLEV